jgi:hypothetical protein
MHVQSHLIKPTQWDLNSEFLLIHGRTKSLLRGAEEEGGPTLENHRGEGNARVHWETPDQQEITDD